MHERPTISCDNAHVVDPMPLESGEGVTNNVTYLQDIAYKTRPFCVCNYNCRSTEQLDVKDSDANGSEVGRQKVRQGFESMYVLCWRW